MSAAAAPPPTIPSFGPPALLPPPHPPLLIPPSPPPPRRLPLPLRPQQELIIAFVLVVRLTEQPRRVAAQPPRLLSLHLRRQRRPPAPLTQQAQEARAALLRLLQ